MDHKLIMVAGSTPGAGKSTLSSFLAEQLRLNGVKTLWLYEEAILTLPAFSQFITEILSQQPSFIQSLLSATKEFVNERHELEELLVTDSIFPCFNWLNSQGCSYEVMEDFSRQLQPILDELNPLIIYLTCDAAQAWKRALGFRGIQYEADTLEYMKTWPYYKDKEVTGLETILDYFQQNNELNLQLLADWPNDRLVLNTTSQTLDECKTLILEKLGLTLKSETFALPTEILQKYVGSYKKVEEGPAIPTRSGLNITLDKAVLKIDTYWPNGCNLIPVTETRFDLENTNYYLEFDGDNQFTYFPNGSVCKYVRQ